jgi:hypothetical protein
MIPKSCRLFGQDHVTAKHLERNRTAISGAGAKRMPGRARAYGSSAARKRQGAKIHFFRKRRPRGRGYLTGFSGDDLAPLLLGLACGCVDIGTFPRGIFYWYGRDREGGSWGWSGRVRRRTQLRRLERRFRLHLFRCRGLLPGRIYGSTIQARRERQHARLHEHPERLSGNASLDFCARRRSWLRD